MKKYGLEAETGYVLGKRKDTVAQCGDGSKGEKKKKKTGQNM